MKIYKGYKFRLYPDKKQIELINKTFGCVRFTYNYFLLKYQKDITKRKLINDLKELQEQNPFLKEVDSCALRCAIFKLEDSLKGRLSKKAEPPALKRKYVKQSYQTNYMTYTYNGKKYSSIEIDLKNRKIKLPKLGQIGIKGYHNKKEINGDIINATISKETTGKYYVSVIILEDTLPNTKVEPKKVIGIDLGIKDLITTSNGEKFVNKKYAIINEEKLQRLQRKLSNQERNSKNYFKTKEKIARAYATVKNSRKHHITNIINKIVKDNDIIVSENLEVKKMITVNKNKSAKNIADASFYSICNLLKWKTKLQGKYYYQVDTYFPSSQICSRCGYKNLKIKDLNIRTYTCKNCGLEIDRDINASINIMFEGLKQHYKS